MLYRLHHDLLQCANYKESYSCNYIDLHIKSYARKYVNIKLVYFFAALVTHIIQLYCLIIIVRCI